MFTVAYVEDARCLTISYASQKDIDDLTLDGGDAVEEFVVEGDHIDRLRIPDGVEMAYIYKTGLKKLHVPNSVKMLYCMNNLLKKIELPAGIEIVDLSDNMLEAVTFRGGNAPTGLLTLILNGNDRLRELDFRVPGTILDIQVEGCRALKSGEEVRKVLEQIEEERIV